MIKETIQEIAQDLKDTPLRLAWQSAWERCRAQLLAIAYLVGFVTAALFRDQVQAVLTFIAFIALLFLVRKTYQATKANIKNETNEEEICKTERS
jgi:hypothetical protein